MKKIISCLLASFFTLTPCISAFAKTPQTIPASQFPDFSPLLIQKQDVIIGAIGDNYQRLTIKFDDIRKITKDTYQITGFSQVKANKTDFIGTLKLHEIRLADTLHYGVDDEYKTKDITKEGTAIFEYVLNENSKAQYSGRFTGQAKINWYLTQDGKLHYDDIESYSDGFYNRLYDGVWTDYSTGKSKRAVWADYKLTNEIAPDLNIGAGEFSPNSKYCHYGWEAFSNCKMLK